jgi:hypothetical protein
LIRQLQRLSKRTACVLSVAYNVGDKVRPAATFPRPMGDLSPTLLMSPEQGHGGWKTSRVREDSGLVYGIANMLPYRARCWTRSDGQAALNGTGRKTGRFPSMANLL